MDRHQFVPGGPINRDTYVTGLVLPAIAKLPAAGVVASGPLAGRTYGSVVQDVVDYFAWARMSQVRPEVRGDIGPTRGIRTIQLPSGRP